jgi:single-strand DNA-binding protein
MYNKAFLIGNLTRDPEVRYTTSGIAMARFAIAVNRFTSKSAGSSDAGNDVDFINIVAWRKLAEICKTYLKKGQPVAIEGALQIRKYEKDGQQKVFAEVVAENMQMLGRKQDSGQKIVQETADTAGNSIKSDDQEVPF